MNRFITAKISQRRIPLILFCVCRKASWIIQPAVKNISDDFSICVSVTFYVVSIYFCLITKILRSAALKSNYEKEEMFEDFCYSNWLYTIHNGWFDREVISRKFSIEIEVAKGERKPRFGKCYSEQKIWIFRRT